MINHLQVKQAISSLCALVYIELKGQVPLWYQRCQSMIYAFYLSTSLQAYMNKMFDVDV